MLCWRTSKAGRRKKEKDGATCQAKAKAKAKVAAKAEAKAVAKAKAKTKAKAEAKAREMVVGKVEVKAKAKAEAEACHKKEMGLIDYLGHRLFRAVCTNFGVDALLHFFLSQPWLGLRHRNTQPHQ